MKVVIKYLLIAVIIVGCTKSKDERRISRGIWTVKEYTVDGVDSTSSAIYENIEGYKFVLDGTVKDRKENYTFDRIYAVMNDGEEYEFGHWGERNDNKMMFTPEYASLNNLGTNPFIDCGCFPHYDIDYIEKKEMKYSIEYEGKNYEMVFERKAK